MSFTPTTQRHEPDWFEGEVKTFCVKCGRDRDVPNLLHPPYPESPFRKAVAEAFKDTPV